MTVHEAELAAYFGVAPEILRFVPDLLQDLWELGSDPDLVVRWLREEGVAGAGARVLDLGCGKGAVSLAVAGALGCRVDGVDALPAFVEIARREARTRGLEERCRFDCADLREVVGEARGYDAALLVSVGVLGAAEAMVAGCRSCVEPGGLMIIEDSFLREPGPIDFAGYGQLASLDDTRAQLIRHGDAIVRERITPRAEVTELCRRYMTWIEHRAAELSTRHPEHAAAFHAYVEKERRECEILDRAVDCATWMLRRT